MALWGLVMEEGERPEETDRDRLVRLLWLQRDLALELSAMSDLRQALDLCLSVAIRAGGMDCGGIYLANEGGGLSLVCTSGLTDEFASAVARYDAGSPEAAAVMKGAPYYMQRPIPDPRTEGIFRREGLRGTAVNPFADDGRVIGCLVLGSRTRDDTPPHARAALETVAAQIGAAIARIEAEEKLRESQRHLESLFDGLEDLVFVVSVDGKALDANRAALTRLGYTEDELRNLCFIDLHLAERRDEVASFLSETLAGLATVCCVPLRSRDGSLIEVETRMTRGRWGDRDVLIGVSRDVAARRRTEDALRQSEERLRMALAVTSDGFFDNDLGAGRVYYSPGWSRMLGYEPEEIAPVHEEWSKRLHPDDRAGVEQFVTGHHEGRTAAFRTEFRLRHKDGSWRWILSRGRIVSRDAAGKPLRMVGAHTDITDLKAAEEMLRRGEERLRA